MPRTISSTLLAHFGGTVLTICTCVLITRTDGVIVGLTDHDAPLVFGGISYSPNDAINMSALKSTSTTGVDNMEGTGPFSSSVTILSSQKITEADLLRGKYNSAEVEYFQVNYSDLSMDRLLLLRANLGELTLEDGKWTTEIRSLSGQLKQYVGKQTSVLCRVRRLGNFQCKISIASWTDNGVTVNAIFSFKRLSLNITKASDYYTNGILRCTSGANAGIEREIRLHDQLVSQAFLTLRTAFPEQIASTDVFSVEAGCSRRFSEDCKTKFNNVSNFRGEPHVPGNSKVIRTGRQLS